MPIITANRDTKLTETPLDSSDPKVGSVFFVPGPKDGKPGQKLAIGFNKLSQDINGKAAVEFEPHITIRGQRWKKLYIFLPHWDGVDEVMRSKVATASTFSAAGSDKLLLPITHRDQNDNSANTGQGPGNRQCALTSVVMFLEAMRGPEWLKQQSAGYRQPEDWYATELTRRGFDTTDPQAHAKILRERFGIRVEFRCNLSLADAKDAIERGCGLVSGVRWSSSGHYQFAMGKHLTKGGLYYLDPYGKRGLTDTAALDYYVEIGGKQEPIYWPIPVVKDAWLDLGDRAGWGLWPEDGTYGFYYEKPQVTIAAPQHTSNKLKPQEFRVLPEAIEIIKSWEGFSATRYLCSAGVPTIGWGSTRWFDGGPIPASARVNEQQATELLSRDLQQFVAQIASAIDVALTPNQLAALTSWQYNTGAIHDSTLRKVVNSGGSDAAVCEQIRRWNKADGKVVQGLINRRESECALWMGRDWRSHR